MVYNSLFRNAITKFSKNAKVARPFHSSTSLAIQVGETIPGSELAETSPSNKVNIHDLCKNKKIVIFGVPGAFTPGCSKTHLPGYVQRYDEIKSKGIDTIVCVAVNDVFVMHEWGKQQQTEGKIRMLADADASFTKALNLHIQLAPLGGIRSKRYSMVVEDCVVKQLAVEPDGIGLSCSLADKLEV